MFIHMLLAHVWLDRRTADNGMAITHLENVELTKQSCRKLIHRLRPVNKTLTSLPALHQKSVYRIYMIYQDLTCKSCLILQSCKMTLKRGVTDARQIRALGIQLAGSGCKIVREQNETLGMPLIDFVPLCSIAVLSIGNATKPAHCAEHTVWPCL